MDTLAVVCRTLCVVVKGRRCGGAVVSPAGRHHQQLQEEEVRVESFVLARVHHQAREQVRQKEACDRCSASAGAEGGREFVVVWRSTFTLPQLDCVLLGCTGCEVDPLPSQRIIYSRETQTRRLAVQHRRSINSLPSSSQHLRVNHH